MENLGVGVQFDNFLRGFLVGRKDELVETEVVGL